MKIKTPELDKLKEIQKETQAISAFLDWLTGTKKIHLCTYEEKYYNKEYDEEIEEGYYDINVDINELLADYFNINLNEVEKEKQLILKELRKQNEN